MQDPEHTLLDSNAFLARKYAAYEKVAALPPGLADDAARLKGLGAMSATDFWGNIGGFARSGASKGINNMVAKAAPVLAGVMAYEALHRPAKMGVTRRQRRIFEQLVANDPIISQEFEQDPTKLQQAFVTMTNVSPTLSQDVNAAQSFLREVAMSPGGGIDYGTLRGLAEAEGSVAGSDKSIHPGLAAMLGS